MNKFNSNNAIFVDWAITTKCNLSCLHCRYYTKSKIKNQKSKIELNSNQAQKLALNIKKLNPNWILIEGGEPFLRKDLFSIIRNLKPRMYTDDTKCHPEQSEGSQKILRYAQNDKRERPVYIITSGKGFNEELAEKCRENNIRLMISVDSGIKRTYERIRKGAKFNDAIKAIKIANKYNLLDSINYTLQELNTSSKEINAIGNFANKYNVNKINFLGYKPNICTVKNTSKPNYSIIFNGIQNIKEKYNLNIMVDEPFFKPWLLNSKFKIQNSKFTKTGPIIVEDKSGCIFGEYLFIEPDGTLKPCSFSPISINTIGKKVIKKIQDKRNRKGKCGKCEYLLQCGGCRVRTYVMTGDWLASDPFCPL